MTDSTPHSRRSDKWGLSNGGLRPLSAICAQSSTTVYFCGLGPLLSGTFCRQSWTIVDKYCNSLGHAHGTAEKALEVLWEVLPRVLWKIRVLRGVLLRVLKGLGGAQASAPESAHSVDAPILSTLESTAPSGAPSEHPNFPEHSQEHFPEHIQGPPPITILAVNSDLSCTRLRVPPVALHVSQLISWIL